MRFVKNANHAKYILQIMISKKSIHAVRQIKNYSFNDLLVHDLAYRHDFSLSAP